MDVEQFWYGTPAEHGLFLEGASLARRDVLNALTVAAWQMVAFDRSKRLPDLQRVLSRRAEREERETSPAETREQMTAKWRHFFERARVARSGR